MITSKRLYHQLRTLNSYRPISLASLRRRYRVEQLNDGKLLQEAKRLHAAIYLRRGYVGPDDLENDIIHEKSDPYQHHAHYFAVIDTATKEVVALARQIYQEEGKILPVFKHMKLDADYSYLHSSQVVEISALAKKSGVDSRALLLLFHAMASHSKNGRHRYWLLACDTVVFWRLKALFGSVIRQVGPEAYYMGSNVIPAEIDIDASPVHLKRNYQLSLPPLRTLRKFLYSSFTEPDERKKRRPTPRALFWDAYGKAYDGLLYFQPYKHLVEHVAEKVVEHHPVKVLDLGCGTGNVTHEILKLQPNLKVDAVDWSEEMLKQLTTKVKPTQVNIYKRDIMDHLRVSRKKYDVIVMNNVLYTVSDRDKLWDLLWKRLASGGYMVFANPDTGDSSQLLKSHLEHDKFSSLIKPKLLKVWAFDSMISLFGAARSYDFSSEAEVRAQLMRHKFEIIGDIERCYGGHKKGIDLLVTARKVTDSL